MTINDGKTAPDVETGAGIPADEFDASYYGDLSDDGLDTNFEDEVEVEHADTDTDDADDSVDDATDKDEPFILDDIDLSHIPKELRGKTLEETLQKIDEARKSKETEAESSLSKLQEMLQKDAKDNTYVKEYQANLKNVDAEVERLTKEAKAFYQSKVDANLMTEAEANFEYGQYKKELAMQKEAYKTEAHNATNLAIVDDFIKNNAELLKSNPLIAKAAEVLITDVINDGNIVSTERSMQYLDLSKQIYDEGYKAGLTAAKQASANKVIEETKKKVGSPQVKQGAVAPKKGGIPYTSAADVPQHVWNANKEIRDYFLSRETF